MRNIVLTLAVLLAAFWLTSDACGQCVNGQCRKPVAKALAAPVVVTAKVVRDIRSVGAATVHVLGKVVEEKPVRKVATAPVRYVYKHQPVRRFFRCRCR